MIWNGNPWFDEDKIDAERKSNADPWPTVDDLIAGREGQAKLEQTETRKEFDGWPGEAPF